MNHHLQGKNPHMALIQFLYEFWFPATNKPSPRLADWSNSASASVKFIILVVPSGPCHPGPVATYKQVIQIAWPCLLQPDLKSLLRLTGNH